MKFYSLRNAIVLMSILLLLVNCNQQSKKNPQIKIDYSSKQTLVNLIDSTPITSDTLFLGFTFGMTNKEFQNQIEKLRKEGKTITFSNSNKYYISTDVIELGPKYSYETSISAKYAGKAIFGKGKYILEPIFSENGGLKTLNILPIEEWDMDISSLDKPNWLNGKIQEKYGEFSDYNLKTALIENDFINENNLVWKKGNLIIYETGVFVCYSHLQTVYKELLLKLKEKEKVQKESDDASI